MRFQKAYLHVDLDAFFASVEQLDHPEYRGKPVIVGGKPGDRRSVVSTCSYEARKYGVHSAMPTVKAYSLCPNGIYVYGRMHRYHEKSREVMSVFSEFSPDVQQMSVDEAFIDITGTEKLFGPPETTAQLLKKRVFEKTNLTVSVGLAQTKYLAKIASGLHKPNGLVIINPGDEQKFMMELPLNKVWGLGTKSQEKLNNYGFYTTTDIYSARKESLCSLFGSCTGMFLYNVVRGFSTESFNEETKSKSLSSERTFCFDLTDIYTIETELMDLAYDVMFRMMKEGWISKTVHLKIRYEDFSTISIQDTYTSYISSIDDLFFKATTLLHKKYTVGHGIRLIGLGVQNMEKSSTPQQGELFDFGELKKQKVEKTILEIQKKDPNNKLRRARQFIHKSIIFVFLLFYFNTNIHAETKNPIFSFTTGTKNVEFIAEGSWESSLSASSSFTIDNSIPKFFLNPLVFTQKVDMSVWFLLDKKFYFEASFADGFAKNTIAAGYKGQGILKHARIGNRDIVFPLDYSLNNVGYGIGGGSIQSPGIMAEFGSDKWKSNLAIRFDMLETHTKSWSGMNEISSTEIELTSWDKGRVFILPDKEITEKISAIYIEDINGNYSDEKGNKYSILDPSTYLIISSRSTIYFRTKIEKKILVQINDITNYFDRFLSFIKQTEQWFCKNNNQLSQQFYLFLGLASYDDISNLFINITKDSNIITTLSLYTNTFLSPFEDSSLYLLNMTKNSKASVISSKNGLTNQNYSIESVDNTTGDSSKNYFRIKNNSNTFDYTDPALRFPVADIYPLIYLEPNSSISSSNITDLKLLITGITPVQRYDIGTNAVPGTVTALRNGISEQCIYNIESGTVTFLSEPSDFDIVKISWCEYSNNVTTPVLSAAAGIKYFFNDTFFLDAAFSTRWAYTVLQNYTTPSSSAPGNIHMATGISYSDENKSLTNTFSTGLTINDVTGYYKMLPINGNNIVKLPLLESAIFPNTENLIPLLQQRPGSIHIPPILTKDKYISIESSIKREDGIEGYVLNFFGSTTNTTSNNQQWTYQTIQLSSESSQIASARQLHFKLKAIDIPQGSSIYLQLGICTDKENLEENSDFISTWLISKENETSPSPSDVIQPFLINNNEWQDVKVIITDLDRSRLYKYHSARIIIVNDLTEVTSQKEQINVNIADFSLNQVSFSIDKSPSDIMLVTEETLAPINSLKKVSISDAGKIDYVQHFSWNRTLTTKETIEVSRFISSTSLTSYSEIGFYLYIPNTSVVPNIAFYLDSFTAQGTSTIQINVPNQEAKKAVGKWYKFSLPIISEDSPTKLRIIFSGNEITSTNKNTSIYFEELYASGITPEYLIKNNTEFKYKKVGSILSFYGIDLISNFNLYTTVTESFQCIKEIPKFTVSSLFKVNSDITFFNLAFNIDYIINQNLLRIGEHHIKLKDDCFFSDYFKITEAYLYNKELSSLNKKNTLLFTLNPFNIPFTIRTEAEATQNFSNNNQNLTLLIDTENFGSTKFWSMNIKTTANQETELPFDSDNYFSGLEKITKLQFSDGNNSTKKRNEDLSVNQVFTVSKNFSPSISLSANNTHSSILPQLNIALFTEKYEFPLKFTHNNFSFLWIRESRIQSNDLNENSSYYTDFDQYNKGLPYHISALATFPIYDFFSPTLNTKNQEIINSISYADLFSYTSTYSCSWQRSIFSSLLDFFLPSSLAISASREMRTSLNSQTDGYILKFGLNYTSLNCFGSYGFLPIFTWYTQDETISSINFLYNIDVFSLSGFSTTTFYINQNNYLRNSLEYQIQTNKSWMLKNKLIWEYPSDNSIILSISNFLFPDFLKGKNVELSSHDGLSISFINTVNTNESILTQQYSYEHSSTVKIVKNLTVTLGEVVEVIIKQFVISITPTISLSGKISF